MSDLLSIFFENRTEDQLWEFFHANTKLAVPGRPGLQPGLDSVARLNQEVEQNRVAEIEVVVATGGKRYATASAIPFGDMADAELPSTLGEAFVSRCSSREYAAEAPDLRTLATLCRLANGWRAVAGEEDSPRRHAPSAGALYPLELYMLSSVPIQAEQETPANAVWHYEPTGDCLERILCCTNEDFAAVFLQWPQFPPPLTFLFTGVPGRQTWKYGSRAYRYALMEAGHAAQNLLLAATALGLAACPIVGFIDDAIHDLLDIDGVTEVALYAVFLGPPAAGSVTTNLVQRGAST